jgi:hypothetical protein
MCVQKIVKKYNLFIFLVLIGSFLGACEAMDNLLSSAGTYKINVQIDGIPLNECSYVKSSDNISVCFEEPVSGDPDVTALMVFLNDPAGEIVGWKVIYNIDPEAEQKEKARLITENINQNEDESLGSDKTAKESSAAENKTPVLNKHGDELIIPVLSLDDELPSFPIPGNLSMGKFTIVSQVMSGKDVLQKTERNIFYLGNVLFSYEGINVYLPGVADTSHLIPKESVIMLEAKLDFDKRLDPYIVWYDGKNKINEGRFSEGAGYLFWKAPEQNGFFSLCAEVFPVESNEELTGYKKELSLLVSSKIIDVHLVSKKIEQLTHWYVMEGNLNDSKNTASVDRALSPGIRNKPKWMGLDGTYGLATGYNNILKLPKISVLNKDTEIWQTLFRFKPLSNGVIFSVQFGSSADVSMFLKIEGKSLILTLTSPQKTVSQTINLSEVSIESSETAQETVKDISFLTVGIKFSIQSGLLSAQINIIGDLMPVELDWKPITLEAKIKNEFNIVLGASDESSLEKPESSAKQVKANVSPDYTALWDEFALYYMPRIDILAASFKPVTSEDQPVVIAEN